MIELDIKKKINTVDGDILLDVAMKIAPGEFACIYGDSGTGKTTLLRILAGLENVATGYVKANAGTWFDDELNINIPPQMRNTGFVTQNPSLFPNMNVLENILYGVGKKVDKDYLEYLLIQCGVECFKERKPQKLSGGQQQRVALIRALIRKPALLLLDEPFSALDVKTRQNLQDLVVRIHKMIGVTTLMVSHDTSEISKVAQKVFILDKGKIQKSGPPADIFSAHAMSGKFRFMGKVLSIDKVDIINKVTISVGNDIVFAAALDEEIRGISEGGYVYLVSKAFNPVILPALRSV